MPEFTLNLMHIEVLPTKIRLNGPSRRADNVDVVTVSHDQKIRELVGQLNEVRVYG